MRNQALLVQKNCNVTLLTCPVAIVCCCRTEATSPCQGSTIRCAVASASVAQQFYLYHPIISFTSGFQSTNSLTNILVARIRYTLFEGGTRVSAFISGGVVPKVVRGTTTNSMIHEVR